jgi:hypothetical protein
VYCELRPALYVSFSAAYLRYWRQVDQECRSRYLELYCAKR